MLHRYGSWNPGVHLTTGGQDTSLQFAEKILVAKTNLHFAKEEWGDKKIFLHFGKKTKQVQKVSLHFCRAKQQSTKTYLHFDRRLKDLLALRQTAERLACTLFEFSQFLPVSTTSCLQCCSVVFLTLFLPPTNHFYPCGKKVKWFISWNKWVTIVPPQQRQQQQQYQQRSSETAESSFITETAQLYLYECVSLRGVTVSMLEGKSDKPCPPSFPVELHWNACCRCTCVCALINRDTAVYKVGEKRHFRSINAKKRFICFKLSWFLFSRNYLQFKSTREEVAKHQMRQARL